MLWSRSDCRLARPLNTVHLSIVGLNEKKTPPKPTFLAMSRRLAQNADGITVLLHHRHPLEPAESCVGYRAPSPYRVGHGLNPSMDWIGPVFLF